MQPITKKDNIPTPAALIDTEIVRRNIKTAQSYFDTQGLSFRPHIKTHKLPEFAKAQLDAGACGINAQKISEANVFAVKGIDDILITYNIIGDEKLTRLRALRANVSKLCVMVDSEYTIDGLAQYFDKETPLEVMIECDTGGGRVGVQSPEAALHFAQLIDATPGLLLRGLMTYPAKGGVKHVEAFMSRAKGLIEAAGLSCEVISSGGTPDIWRAHEASSVTEYRAGTYIYNDRSLVEGGYASFADCAFRVLATVVSTPTDNRAVIDAGSKTLSSDLIGLTHYGMVIGRPDLKIVGLSEEHGVIEGRHNYKTGDRIEILPNHVCVVSNLLNEVWISEGVGYRSHLVAARGTVI